MRKLFVNVAATVALLLLGGAALAADEAPRTLDDSEPLPVETDDPTAGEAAAEQTEEPAPETTEEPLEPSGDEVEPPAAGPVTASVPEGEDGERNGFGATRSAEVRQFGQCMAETDGDRGACAHLKPGPAWRTPGHPGKGAAQGRGQRAGAASGDEGGAEAHDRGFGRERSAAARAFGQCMAESRGDRGACEHLKPGPAWSTPGHPGEGRAHGRGDRSAEDE